MQKFSDAPLTTCEKCGGALKKLISNTAFVLKGTGWYATDYAKPGTGVGGGEKAAADKPSTDSGNTAPAADKASSDAARPAASTSSSTAT
jgi:predicted nucleic acid-binding Zn ribbon protein